MAKVRKDVVAKSLENWLTLNEHISSFTEEEVLYAMKLENERDPEPRATFLRRLSQRLRGVKIEELKRELKDAV